MNSDEEARQIPVGTKVRVTHFMGRPYFGEGVTGTLVRTGEKEMDRGVWYIVKIETADPDSKLTVGDEFPCQWSEIETLEEKGEKNG